MKSKGLSRVTACTSEITLDSIGFTFKPCNCIIIVSKRAKVCDGAVYFYQVTLKHQ